MIRTGIIIPAGARYDAVRAAIAAGDAPDSIASWSTTCDPDISGVHGQTYITNRPSDWACHIISHSQRRVKTPRRCHRDDCGHFPARVSTPSCVFLEIDNVACDRERINPSDSTPTCNTLFGKCTRSSNQVFITQESSHSRGVAPLKLQFVFARAAGKIIPLGPATWESTRTGVLGVSIISTVVPLD